MPILAYRYPIYQPSMRIISTITNDNPGQVTTTFPHQYKNLLVVRLNIPPGFGMVQANQLIATITIIDATNFTINIDTTMFFPFTIPTEYPNSYQSATVVPIGEDNSILNQATNNVLPYSAT